MGPCERGGQLHEPFGALNGSEAGDKGDHHRVGAQTEPDPCSRSGRKCSEPRPGRDHDELVGPSDPGCEEVASDPIPHCDEPIGRSGQHSLDADDRRPTDWRKVPMKKMSVKTVHRRWDPARPGGQSPEYTGLGRMRMDDMRAKLANDVDQTD